MAFCKHQEAFLYCLALAGEGVPIGQIHESLHAEIELEALSQYLYDGEIGITCGFAFSYFLK